MKFDQVTPMFLEKFEKFQLNKGLSVSTLEFYLRPLRRIVNIEIANQNFPENKYPFSQGKYTIPIGKKAFARDVISRIISYHDSADPVIEEYREMWLFSFFCNGMNVADICHLTYDDLEENRMFLIKNNDNFY